MWDEFLAPADVEELLEAVRLLRDRGGLAPARIGGGANVRRDAAVRGDSTCWLPDPPSPVEHRLRLAIEALRTELNREAFLGLWDSELHYAWYPPHAHYARHVDRPRGRCARQVSLALYLNRDWRGGSGGELRMFEDDGSFRDIEPIGGRLVYFSSAGREHSVLPTRVDRFSVSGWLRSRD